MIYCSICLALRGQLPPDLVKMKRTSESATWVLKMCRNFFFYFLIYVPLPLESLHDTPPPAPVGEFGLKEEFLPPQSPGQPDLGVWGSAPQFPPGSNASRGAQGLQGWGWGADLWGPWRQTPKMGRPILAVSSPNHHSLEVQPPWSSDSNKSFYTGQHIFSQFPMKRPVGFHGA